MTLICALLALVGCTADPEDTGPNDSNPGDDTGEDSGYAFDQITDIQQGAFTVGDAVTVKGVAGHDVTPFGFYLLDADSGPWSGIWIELEELGDVIVRRGSEVVVEGTYAEAWDSFTTIEVAASDAVLRTGNPGLPDINAVPITDFASDTLAEPWEGTRVEFGAPTITAIDDTTFTLDGTLTVDATLHDWSSTCPSLAVDDVLTSVSGFVYYEPGTTSSGWALQPAVAGDLVGCD